MEIKVYTDGACSENPGPGGWAAVFALKSSVKVFSGNEKKTTNNRMELKSVIEAIKVAISKGVDELAIHSDSAYVVSAINLGWVKVWKSKGWVNSKKEQVKNKDLWEELLECFEKYNGKIRFVKVKGHSGDPLNELADITAKREVMNAKQSICD